MMTEIKWKVFFAGIVTAGIFKLFGSGQDIFALLCFSWLGWIGVVIVVVGGERLWQRWHEKRHKKASGDRR